MYILKKKNYSYDKDSSSNILLIESQAKPWDKKFTILVDHNIYI